jgi:hypothetical protein
MGSTNWSKARFLQAANFHPAVTSSSYSTSEQSSVAQPGTCVSYWGTPIGKNDFLSDVAIIYGKDVDRNC